mgnify:CR=1 FL=1
MEQSTRLMLRGVSKRYTNGVQALDGVELSISPGLYGLLGPNGAGKSTLMRTIATLQEPDQGDMSFEGIDVLSNPNYLRRRLGYLPQQLGVYPGATAKALLHRFAYLKGRTDRKERETEVSLLLEQVNLSADAHREVSTYSGGMMRRFGIALALVGRPQLLIVDEPTAGLDPVERNRFHRMLASVAADAIVLLSTHIVEDVENLCSRFAILAGGKIVCEGTPKALCDELKGQLWEKVLLPDAKTPDALHLSSTPAGIRIVVEAEKAPDDSFVSRTPRLEDVYHSTLRKSGYQEA